MSQGISVRSQVVRTSFRFLPPRPPLPAASTDTSMPDRYGTDTSMAYKKKIGTELQIVVSCTNLPLTPVLLSLMNRKALPMLCTFHVPTP